MSEKFCPNINSCRMVTTPEVLPDIREKESYMHAWCRDEQEKWRDCKRFSSKASLGFCPDFVLPDTALTIDEIVDKFEENL